MVNDPVQQADGEESFDVEEFRALRQEILHKVDANARLEVFAVTGAAAIYAWLTTTGTPIGRVIWYVPVLLPVLGFLRAVKLGKQMTIAGDYLRLLETRRRPTEIGRGIHGWEGYVHQPEVWRKFKDRAGLFFWISFIALTAILSSLLAPM
jgi:hypothetical protein